ncbi:Vacuolar fusion protein CCZ1 -like protein, partial [Caligus rogercresseyi]
MDVSRSSKIMILRFFIFDADLKCKEGEEEKKILYYWSRDLESIDVKCRYVGLMEGVLRFGSVFSDGSSLKCLSTQKTRTVFHSPEPGIILVLSVTVPCKVVPSKKNLLEFRSENMDMNIYRSILIRSLDMYEFFNGARNREPKCLSQFFNQLIPTLQISSSSIFDLLPSIRFLTLSPRSFLRVASLMNKVETLLHPQMHSATFVHEEKVVWSTLEQTPLILLFSHIKNSVLAKDLKDSTKTENNAQNPFQGHCGRVLLGGPKAKRYELVVYGALQSLVVLTISNSVGLGEDSMTRMLKELDSFLGPPLTSLSVDLCDVYGKVSDDSGEDSVENRFLYYNASNRALKSTVLSVSKETQPLQYKVMADVYSDIERISEDERGRPLWSW